MKGGEIVRASGRHSSDTATLRKRVALYINTCDSGFSNISANLRVVTLKLLEFTQFASLNLSIYFSYVQVLRFFVMSTFLNSLPVRSPSIEKSMPKLMSTSTVLVKEIQY